MAHYSRQKSFTYIYLAITLSNHQMLVGNKPMFILNPHIKVINQLITPYAKVIKRKDMLF